MKSLLLLTIILFIANILAFSQPDNSKQAIDCIAAYRKKEKYNYRLSHRQLKINNQDTLENLLVQYQYSLQVLDSNSFGFILLWKIEDVTTNSQDAFINAAAKVKKGLQIKYAVNKYGTFEKFMNPEEVKTKVSLYCSSLMPSFGSDYEGKKAILNIENNFETRDMMEKVAIPEIQLYHMFHGARYEINNVLQLKIKVPIIYATQPVDADFMAKLDRIEPKSETYVLKAKQVVDKEQLTDILMSYFTGINTKTPENIPDRSAFNDLKNETTTAMRFHLTGWLVFGNQTNTVKIAEKTEIDELKIELQTK